MEIFGVLVGVAIRWISLGLFVYWAIRSFGVSKVISGRTMATAASISFFLNFGTLFSLYYRRKNSKISKPNQQLIHLEDLKFQVSLPGAGTQRLDFARSLIVVAVSGVIWAYPDRCIFDKICTLITAFFVFASTISTLKQCAQVLMEGTPPDLNYHEIREALSCIPRVHSVHDLHIWSVKFSRPVLTAHLRTLPSVDNTHVLLRAHRLLRTHFRIQQATIQIDPLPPPPPNDPT